MRIKITNSLLRKSNFMRGRILISLFIFYFHIFFLTYQTWRNLEAKLSFHQNDVTVYQYQGMGHYVVPPYFIKLAANFGVQHPMCDKVYQNPTPMTHLIANMKERQAHERWKIEIKKKNIQAIVIWSYLNVTLENPKVL